MSFPMLPTADIPIKPKLSFSDHNINHPRAFLFVTILSLQICLLLTCHFISVPFFSTRSSIPNSVADVTSQATATNATAVADPSCPLGRIYVYNLPSTFNADLVSACDDLNPWKSRCSALANSGFGLPFSKKLSSVIPPSLLPAWFATDQFSGEVIYHRRILAHPCRTTDPSTASGFYIPFYVGLAVGKVLWGEKINNTASARDHDCIQLLNWVTQQPSWKKSGGKRHFMMVGRITWDFRRFGDKDWGSSFLHMPRMENVTRLLIERDPWDNQDVGVPYPTGFHPRSISDVRQWQTHILKRNRTTLFSFAGAARSRIKNDFRGVLLSQCAKEGAPHCKSVDCSKSLCEEKKGNTLKLFLESKFCLQPRGDSYTRRSIFDCMIAGAIPVFFWKRSAYIQYDWFLPGKQEEYSVMVDRYGVKNGSVEIRKVLEGLSEEKVRKMREKLVDLLPKLVYASPETGLRSTSPVSSSSSDMEDAFEVAVDGVMKRWSKNSDIKI